MRFLCGPGSVVSEASDGITPLVLYERLPGPGVSAGAAVKDIIRRQELKPAPEAWDFLSIALSVIAADGTIKRSRSPDGWTRSIELDIALNDHGRWSNQEQALTEALAFLTTDIWRITTRPHGDVFKPSARRQMPDVDAVVLLSGGLDSLVGAIDLNANGERLLAVSQTVRGDSSKQIRFARVGGSISHLQLNHNGKALPGAKEASQRSRSLIFLAFAVLAATTTQRYNDGERVPIYVCENGFIAINPPLTEARLGSLSTRTAHPCFLTRMQSIFGDVGLRVDIRNPYAHKTKGEMLKECRNQSLLESEASRSTSCGRFQRFNYTHCGRCVPCQIRRAAFLAWEINDDTEYVYEDLGRKDEDHAAFDDVRAVAMALASVKQHGLDRWLGTALSSSRIANRAALREMVERGLDEIATLHEAYRIE